MNTMVLTRPTELHGCRGRLPAGPAATLSAEWGSYRTPAGQAAYFALAFHGERP